MRLKISTAFYGPEVEPGGWTLETPPLMDQRRGSYLRARSCGYKACVNNGCGKSWRYLFKTELISCSEATDRSIEHEFIVNDEQIFSTRFLTPLTRYIPFVFNARESIS